MSAEKSIVNYWLNKKGFFTLNNISLGSRDMGIIAVKANEGIQEVMHVEVSCSISNPADVERKKIAEDLIGKFQDKELMEKIIEDMPFPSTNANYRKILVLAQLPIAKKQEIIDWLKAKNIEVIEFEEILAELLQKLDTHYFRDDVIRTLQLVKYLLLADPGRLAEILSKETTLTAKDRGKFFNQLLEQELMKKVFSKTEEQHIIGLLKSSALKPEKLASILENDILNRRTRKAFISSLIEQEKTGMLYRKQTAKPKLERPLARFF